MTKLLVHVGYPKTASTTLQNSLFTALDQMGLIQYLGKSRKKTAPVIGQINRWVVEGYPCGPLKVHLASDCINLLSLESLTSNAQYRARAHHTDALPDERSYASRLHALLSQLTDDIQILIILRNQADFLFSYYVEKYHQFVHSEPTCELHFFNQDGSFRYDRFRHADYAVMVDSYVRVFGRSNVRLVFFEDLVHRAQDFHQALADFLGIDRTQVQALIGSTHLNKKASRNGKRIQTVLHYQYRNLLRKFPLLQPVYQYLRVMRKTLLSEQVVLKCDRRDFEIAELRDDQRQRIMHAFTASNHWLYEDFQLDL